MKLYIKSFIVCSFLLSGNLHAQYYVQKYYQEPYFFMSAVEDMDGDGNYEVLSDNEVGFYMTRREGKQYTTKSLLPQLGGEDLPYLGLNYSKLLSIGDIDGNGKKDMVVPDGTGKLFLYKQDLNGNFAKSIIAEGVGNTAYSILKDIDGDNDLDIVSFYPLHLKIFINVDGFVFNQVLDYSLHSAYVQQYIQDIDGDDKMEIILLYKAYSPEILDDIYKLKVLQFDSTAQSLVPLTTDLKIEDYGQPSIQFNDLDSDGDLDFFAYWGNRTKVYEYVNEGNLNYTIHSFDVGVNCIYPALTDINNDGHTDLIIHANKNFTIVGKDNLGNYAVLKSLTFDRSFDAKEYSRLVDFDQDGDLDLLSNNVLFKNTNQWNIITYDLIINCAETERQILDLDNDNDLDLIAGNIGGLFIMEQYAPYKFNFHAIPIPNTFYLDKIQQVQFDGDPAMEFIASYNDSVMLIDQVTGWEYQTRFLFRTTLNNLTSLLPGDMDNDGDLDFVHFSQTFGNNLEWYENRGSDGFTPHILFNQLWWVDQARLMDYEKDGDMDIIALVLQDGPSYSTGQLRLYRNNGSGEFVSSILTSEYKSEFNKFWITDLDHDNDLDFLIALNNLGTLKCKGAIKRSDGSYFLKDLPNVPYSTLDIVPSAINGENIFLSKYSETQMGWYTVDQFLSAENHAIPGRIKSTRSVLPTDFDMDGDLDLFVQGETYAPITQSTLDYLFLENVSADSVSLLNINVFLDKNKNGIHDIPDEEYGFHSIGLSPEKIKYFSSSPIHQYQIQNGIHEVMLSGFDPDLWEVTSGLNPVQISIDAQHPHPTISFGLAPKVLQYKLDVDLTVTPVFCNRSMTNFLQLKNSGTLNVNLAESQIYFDPAFKYLNTYPDPVEVTNQEVTHDWSEWKVNTPQSAYLYLKAPNESTSGKSYITNVEVILYDSLGQSISFKDTIKFVNRCAIDPNSIEVNPQFSDKGYILNVPSKLEYTVHFQNLGNAPAENIRIQSQLPSYLDPASIEILSSSNPQRLTGRFDLENRILTVDFFNINLPDTSSGWAESQGYVKYTALTKAGLLPGTLIIGDANIFFDLNQPIKTNNIRNTVVTCSLLNDVTIKVDSIISDYSYSLEVNNPILDSVRWISGNSILSDSISVKLNVPNGQTKDIELIVYSPLCVFDTIITLGTTAVEPSDENMKVFVYPSITSDELHVDYNNQLFTHLEYIIFSTTGMPMGKSLKLESNRISTHHLFPGLYFLQLRSSDGKLFNLKFVKK